MELIITCRVCQQPKDSSEFAKRSDSPNGYRSDCKLCEAARNQAYRSEHIDELREKQRARNAANADKYNAARREKFANDPEYRERVNAARRSPEYKTRKNELRKAHYANDPEYRESIQADHRRRYHADPEYRKRCIDNAKDHYLIDPIQVKERNRKSTLKRFYRLTPESYRALSDAQGGRCLICGRLAEEADPHRKALCVDHDHSCCPGNATCGQCTRGLICGPCNSGLGHFGDSIERLESALTYLRAWRESQKPQLVPTAEPVIAA